jgi:dynein heavy chain
LDPVFLTAPTGTGKTTLINQILKKSGNANLFFTFTAQTSPSVAQIQLESKLQTQRKSGNITLIPPPGKKFIYFIDDINMPAIEEYGAQPPIEMLRLLLGMQGVWDRKHHFFKSI